jgi:hypothetical protein
MDEAGGQSDLSEQPRCFVVGPIGDKFALPGTDARQTYEDALEVLTRVILPACTAVGLDPVRADKIQRPGEITEQVCRHLRDDDVVIADVTDANPNVMYELGLRHSRNLLTIPLGEVGRLPFDISVIRTIPFVRDEYELIEARDNLKDLLEAGLAGKWDPVTATRVWSEGTRATETAEGPVEPADDEPDEPGFLELLADAEDAQVRMLEHADAIRKVVEEMGALAERSTPKMLEAPNAGAKLLLANRYAQELEPKAESLETLAGLYADAVKRVDNGITYLLDRIERGEISPEERTAAIGLLNSLVGAGQAAETSIASVRGLADAVVGTSKATRLLRQPTQRVARALNRFNDATGTAIAWGSRAQTLLPTLE